MSDHHACSTCITDRYSDERRVHTSFCGLNLDADRTIKGVGGLEYIASCNCEPCLAGLDAWASQTPQEDNLFRLWKRGQVVAACPTIEAHDAARRLLGAA